MLKLALENRFLKVTQIFMGWLFLAIPRGRQPEFECLIWVGRSLKTNGFKSVSATAGNVASSLRSERILSSVPHFKPSAKIDPTEMKMLLRTLPLLALGVVSLTTCESNNEKARKKVKALVVSVTPKTILAAINELDQNAPEQEGTLIPLEILPTSLSAFAPIEVQYRCKGSYLIVTDRWVQHRTGLLVAAPGEIVPESSEFLTSISTKTDLH
jgi:hypothetical protein